MKDLVLIGGGGHCRSCIDVIECEGKFRIIGILDNGLPCGTSVSGYDVAGNDSLIEGFVRKGACFIVALGQIRTVEPRKRLFAFLKDSGAKIASAVSPSAYVSKYADIGEGTVIFHHALVNAGAKIGRNCIINSKALIEHDAVVADHCHVSTSATINGAAKIGEGSFIGSGAVVVNNADVGKASFIKSGEIVK
ncbi:MAG: NeuD/PglB/VioB family sugar acetyltransferase [Holosporaceae bacterium]|jgi:sugar O-acyltransferase (sialic acid O-acetyltransferase NeuD family)|nr:NeuD/PglB/VioB family sugar acetyltransferase [Holosporaceae bacterium]